MTNSDYGINSDGEWPLTKALRELAQVEKPKNWNQEFTHWVPTVCEICGANVFTVNVAPHLEWHKRTGTD